MKPGITDLCYGFFSTLANPTRLSIIELLNEGPKNVYQLTEALNQEQSMVSHNLRPLIRCKFVYVQQVGKNRVYRLNKETLIPIVEAVETHAQSYCSGGKLCPVKRRMEAVRKEN